MNARQILSGSLLILMLGGCAARSTVPAGPYARSGEPAPPRTPEVATTATVLGIIATPIYLAFKTVVCAATLVIAAPGAAVLALADRVYEVRKRQDLDEDLAKNCGPPYTLLNNATPAP